MKGSLAEKKPPFEIYPWGVVTYASRQLMTMGFSTWSATAYRFEVGGEKRIK